MYFPRLSVEELLYPYGSGKRLVTQTETAIPRAGKGSAVDERIALDGKRFRLPQVVLTVTVPFIFAEDLFAVVEAQLGEAAGSHEFLSIAAIDVSISRPLVYYGDGQWSAAYVMQKGRGIRRTDRGRAYGLPSGSYIFPAPGPGGKEVRHLIDRGRSCPGG